MAKVSDSMKLHSADSQVTIGSMKEVNTYGNQPYGQLTVLAKGIGHDGTVYDDDVLFKEEPNLILDGARDIIRDVMMGSSGISKITFGDLGKDTSASLSELINVNAPLETDTQLIRKVGQKIINPNNIIPIGRGTSDKSTDRPGIRFTIVLEEAELVPVNRESQFILEMALAGESVDGEKVTDILFSRKTHPVIIKTRDLRLTFIWEILF